MKPWISVASVFRRCLPVAIVALLVTAVLAPTANAAPSATFVVHPSVNQVAVTGADPGSGAALTHADGTRVARGTVDRAGSLLFRNVRAGRGYVVSVGHAKATPVTVASPDATPPQSFYSSQHLDPGYGYLKTRDGTLLSINVRLPGPVDQGPYPTVVEYSGYDPSNPNGRQPASSIAQLLGFATVGINLRGTGCSGGAFDYFEELQSLDGYDAIETVAAQPWVAHGKVGMIGISYPGFTQLFVARTRPPHLAAITPLGVFDDSYELLNPGGILNGGFAVGWVEERQADAKPATLDGDGQRWAAQRIAAGDTTCRDNQALRLQAPDVSRQIRGFRFRLGAASDALAPATFVHDINVPVFMAGTWQDEQTGPHFANMVDDFSSRIPLRVTLMNGVHADSIGPAVLSQWVEFLDFYVAQQIPSIPPAARTLAAAVLPLVFGAGGTLAPDRFTDQPDYASALRVYEAEPRAPVLFDVGADGTPTASFRDCAIVSNARNDPDDLLPRGRRRAHRDIPVDHQWVRQLPVRPRGVPGYRPRPENGGSQLTPTFDWKPLPAGKALAYVTEPLAVNTVMAGTGSVDLWLQSTKPDVDVEVTISEVRPDGQETYVQSGWLRASQRALDAKASTPLLPVQTHTRADAKPLPAGKAALVRVPLYPFGHAFRAGSRIRIVVQPPGGNHPVWAFDALQYHDTVTNWVDRSHAHTSKVVLPLVGGIDVTDPLPACGSLRGQPCRTYVPLHNQSTPGDAS